MRCHEAKSKFIIKRRGYRHSRFKMRIWKMRRHFEDKKKLYYYYILGGGVPEHFYQFR